MGRHLNLAVLKESLATDDDDVVLNSISYRLDGLAIEVVDSLELITHARDLYLHRNCIIELPDMSCLSNLHFLALQHNSLTTLSTANLHLLTQLRYLDVSHNFLKDITASELPISLVILNCSGNPLDEFAVASCLFKALPTLTEVNRQHRPFGEADSPVEGKEADEAREEKVAEEDNLAFSAELKDLQAGLGARFMGLQSSDAGELASAEVKANAARFSERREGIVAKYKAELDRQEGGMQDMAIAAAAESGVALASAQARLRGVRASAVQRSQERSEVVLRDTADAVARLKTEEARSGGSGEEVAYPAEPVWKRVLSALPTDPEISMPGYNECAQNRPTPTRHDEDWQTLRRTGTAGNGPEPAAIAPVNRGTAAPPRRSAAVTVT